ncbi:NAD(P)H-dependent oxidoreductase [Mesorhizobium australicum]|uniref:NAD(P)H dehydrogenase (Quinone) n=1 Tax=Mesorhizobium australicum TaxID=536018 RepID=A0A1X7PMZ8_9HYPH|nr:NAD(P)H-dependent oxidoreductase [Mesorhizobium australicum]SMH52609.1 NAD(P)H dehydrogenase (quinone) [Mesorhizobium australicum]
MNVLIVYAHPEPASFNAAMRDRARDALTRAGHEVVISDLYGEGFNPVAGRHDFLSVADEQVFHYQTEQAHAARHGSYAPDITREQKRVADADLLILQFPLWWGGVPAILKGWGERVFSYGFGYADGLRFDTGVFRGRRAMVSLTSGGTTARFGAGAAYGELERQVLWQIQHLGLEYMGYELEPPFVAYGAPRVDAAGRAAYLDALEEHVLRAAEKPVDRSLKIESPLDLVPDGAWRQQR